MGLGEAMAPSSATDMVARVISQEERSRAMSFIFGGLHVGSLLGLFVAPPLIEHFGWPVVFYGFGILGEHALLACSFHCQVSCTFCFASMHIYIVIMLAL